VRSSNICTNGEQESLDPCFDFGDFKFNQNKKIESDKDVELECYVRNKATYSVIWMFENQLISLNDMLIKPDSNMKIISDNSKKFNLRISHVNEKNRGLYKCQISTLNALNLDYNLDILSKHSQLGNNLNQMLICFLFKNQSSAIHTSHTKP
jgi:hypothetical protein